MSAPSEIRDGLEHLAFEVAQGVSGKTGDAFFRSLAHHLALALEADLVMVGALQQDRQAVRTLGLHPEGTERAGFEYALAGTPCAQVAEGQTVSYAAGVQKLFPQDPKLAELGAEGYAGAPMIDSKGHCTGVLCALTRGTLRAPQIAESLLQMFATRASAELERTNYEEALARLARDNASLVEEINADPDNRRMVGSSPRFRELLEAIRRVAETSATVLITGETGTGKELAARAIHHLSPRRNRPLVKVNCIAISAGRVESELFGHTKGAFPGASEDRAGRIEHAPGGILFLDEISELPLESQAKLLHVLQKQEFEPVGSNRPVKVDVGVFAATNRNLPEAVREGRFHRDLYDRLQVTTVDVPPLRERRQDIPLLAAHFLAALARQFGKRVNRISEGMMQRLILYDWPGNVRELENFLARAVVLSSGEMLDFPVALAAGEGSGAAGLVPRSLREAERQHILRILDSTSWVVEGPKGAARVLEMNPSTLRSLMKRLGIRRPA